MLDQILRAYITDNTRQIATLLEPAVVTVGALYIMIWGMLQVAGHVEKPILTGLKRIAIH